MTSEETGDRERLLFHLENQTGFWFALVVGDDVAPRARLRQAAESWCKEHARAFILHEPGPESLAALAVQLAREPAPGLHWIRADGPQGLIEQWDAAAAQLLLAMNERREAYRKRFDGGVVIEGRESLKRLLRDLAPDLFSIRAFIAEPRASANPHHRVPSEWHLPVSLMIFAGVALDPEREIQRASRLEGLADFGARDEWFDAAFRAVCGLVQAKRSNEAEVRAQELRADAEQRLKGNPEDAESRIKLTYLYMVLGLCAYEADKARVALQYFDETIKTAAPLFAGGKSEASALWWMCLHINKLRGLVLVELNDREGAVEAFQDHLKIIEQIPERNPLHVEMQLEAISTHRALASIWRQENDLMSAERAIRDALSIAKTNSSEHSADERWQIELAQTWCFLGWLLFAKHELRAALDTANAAAAIANRFVMLDPSNKQWQEELAHEQILICLSLLGLEEFSDVHLPAQERALGFVERELEQDPADIDLGWLAVLLYLYRSALLKEKQDTVGSLEAAEQAWKLVKQLPARNKAERWLRRSMASHRSKKARKSKKD